ncbi:hypothetical protein D3C83_120820 [compost metagenome]
MVGFIDPVGTSFQSASADLSELTIRIISAKMRISFRTFFLSIAMASPITGQAVERFAGEL